MGNNECAGPATASSNGNSSRSGNGHKANNLNWKIGLLEAECGLKPRIAACKSVVRRDLKRKRKARQRASEQDGSAGRDAEKESDGERKEKLEQLRTLKEQKLRRKLFQIKRDFWKDAKKAKAFEIQRAVKRLKGARTGNELDSSFSTREVETHETELSLLKVVDVETLSDKIFYSGLKKRRELRNVAVIQRYLEDQTSEKSSPLFPSCSNGDGEVAGRLEARLVSNKGLREALSAHLDDLVQHTNGLGLFAVK